ncbi:MAG: DUF4286 family protein [Chitinophagaceae bacterium]
MFIYNVTTKVSPTIAADWLHWLKTAHIPDIVNTGCFTHAVIHQLLEIDETEGKTYAIQYHCESKALYNLYIEKHAAQMRAKAIEKWGDQFIAFRTVMHIIN